MASDPTALLNYLAAQVGTGIAGSFQQGQNNGINQVQAIQGIRANAAKIAASQMDAQQQQQYQGDVNQWIQAGADPAGLTPLIAKYPKQWEALKAAADAKDKQASQADLRDYGGVWHALDNNHPQAALGVLQARRSAELKAGIDTGEIDHIISGIQSGDPNVVNLGKGFALAQIKAHLSPTEWVKQFGDDGGYTLGADQTRFDRNNQLVARGAPKQMDPFHYSLKDGSGQEHEYIYEPNGGAGAPVPGGSSGNPSGAQGAPLSVRLNNPGAIRFDPSNNWKGQVGQQNGFVQFDTPASGNRAHQTLIANQIRNGYDTPLAWAQHYAPASDGNDPQAYAATVAKGLGIGINDKIPLSAVPKLASLSAQVEAGGTPVRGPNAAAAATSGVTLPGSRQIDSLPINNTPGAEAPGDLSKRGDDYLSTIPSGIRGTVKAVATGQLPLPSSFAQSKPYWQQVMSAVMQYDPTFDSSQQPSRVAAAKAFTGNGKGAQVLASIDRLSYHLNDLYRDSQALTGWNLGPASGLVNAGVQSFQKAAVARYNAALPFIAGELQKLTKNGSATEGESRQIMSNLAPSQPASARLAAMQQLAELTQGQFKPVRDQWASAFPDGRTMPMDVSPEATAILDNINGDKGPAAIDPHTGRLVGNRQSGSARAAPSPVVRVTSMAQATALPPGTRYMRPDGVVMVR